MAPGEPRLDTAAAEAAGEPEVEEKDEGEGEGEGEEKKHGLIGRILGGRDKHEDESADTEDEDDQSASGDEEAAGRWRPTTASTAGEGPADTAASEPGSPAEPESEPDADTDGVDLNRATFEQLRELGFSVTQATRVITYRERQSGFDSVDDLSGVPGMPRTFLNEVRSKLRIG
jgi:DNA uptake protein ComE-like DNA-binding protein